MSTSSFSWNRSARGFLLGFALLAHLVGGHDVELPAGKLARQAHVLAAAADRLRKLVLGDGDVHRMLFFVDDDRLHFGRRHRVDDELRGAVVPQHDVDALAVQFVRHRLHARTAHADAGADRIGAVVVREHGDLGAVARIARARLDLDETLADFRHFELEELHHQFGRGARDEELRSAQLGFHFVEIAAQAIAGAHRFARNRAIARHERLGVAAEIEKDVAALDALDDAGDELADAILVRIDHLRALGFAHALHDDLLGGLRRDAAEFGILDLLLDETADVDAGLLVDRVHQADHGDRAIP